MLCTVLAMFVATACNDRRDAPVDVPHIIRNDGGGQLISAEADRARLLAWGKPVEIHGTCASACVIFTTLPNACVRPDARIGFHGSNVNIGPIGNQQMARYMRGAAKTRYLAEWQYIPPTEIHWIDAQEYQRLDPDVKLCAP
ncbi:hypothetical protein [Yoonia sp. MH D7]